MLGKLALRNAKRSFKDYLVYMITITISFALIFSFNAAIFSKDILELLEQINNDYGTTILIVTHNDAISKMAQRILRLHDGQIISNSLNSSRITAKKLEW